MTDILVPKKNVILDASIFSTVMSCARLADFKYNHNFVAITGKSTSLEMGSIVHKFLEVYYKSVIGGAAKSAAEMHGHGAAELYSQSDEVRNCTPEDRAWALETCHQYLEYYKNDFWVPLEVETVKQKLLYEDDEVRILWKAKLDITMDTNDGIYPMDHKTMKQRRDTVSLNNQFIGQCILMETRKIFINKIGFQKTLKPAERFTRPSVDYTMDTLLEWQSDILPYWTKMYLMYAESGYWPPNFTHCQSMYGNCIFLENVCTAARNLREQALGEFFVVGEPWNPEGE